MLFMITIGHFCNYLLYMIMVAITLELFVIIAFSSFQKDNFLFIYHPKRATYVLLITHVSKNN